MSAIHVRLQSAMPRPPKVPHPLREIRALCGNLSQTAFAKLVGVSMPTIQAIEGGKLKITTKLAARMAEATGVSAEELLKGNLGKPISVNGQRFTLKTFRTWENLKQRRSKQLTDQVPGQLATWMKWLMECAQSKHGSAGTQARTMLVETLEKICSKFDLTDQVNDRLLPFQVVETHSASVAQWKNSSNPRHQHLGYHAGLALKPSQRLTISLQSLPSWSPGTAPPSPIPTNMDLIPAGYFVVGLGTAGCRMAMAWWKSLCAEHGIDFQSGVALYGLATGSWQGFFSRTSQINEADKYVPRAVFADFDQVNLNQLSAASRELFPKSAFLYGEKQTGNVFAGASAAGTKEMVQGIDRLLERQSHDVGGISGVFVMHSLEGGTGGGLGQQVLKRLKSSRPACPIITVSPVPEPALGHSVTAPYNLALTLETVITCANLGLFFDPISLQEEAVKLWKMDIREVENTPNQLMANVLSAFTAPLRFPGSDSQPLLLPDWLRQVMGCESPSGTVLVQPEFRPLQTKFHGKSPTATAEEMVGAFSSLLRPAKFSTPGPLTVLLRARQAEDIWGTSRALSSELKENFRISPHRIPDHFENITVLSEARNLATRLAIFADQAEQLIGRKAYLHWYTALNIDEAEIVRAVTTLRQTANRLISPE